MVSISASESPPPQPARAAEQPEQQQPERPWRAAARSALVVWITSHLAYLIINLLNWRASNQSPPALRSILSAWGTWDSGHYVRIAEFGYTDEFQLDRAFFPLYPMLIRGAHFVLPGNYVFAGLVISSLAAFGALLMLHRLTTLELGVSTADRTIFYLVAFPTAFFLVAPYNHSLFLLFATTSLYAMRTGRWWMAGLMGAMASGTRSVGILLLVPFIYEYARQREFKWKRIRFDALWVALVPGGLIAYALYCRIAFGSFTAFSEAQKYWYRGFDFPWNALWRTIQEPFKYNALDEFSIVNLTDFTAAVVFLALLVLCLVGPWKLRRDQMYLFLFGLAVIMVPLVQPAGDNRPLISMARHVLDVIPAFMVLGRMGESKTFDRLYPMPAIAMQAMFLLIFMHYGWVG